MNAARHAENRRRMERMPFRHASPALMGGHEVRLMDLSLEGAGIEHDVPFSTGRSAALELKIAGTSVRVSATIVRCRLARREQGRLIYQSALEFRAEDSTGRGAVRELMTQLVTEEIESLRHERRLATA